MCVCVCSVLHALNANLIYTTDDQKRLNLINYSGKLGNKHINFHFNVAETEKKSRKKESKAKLCVYLHRF